MSSATFVSPSASRAAGALDASPGRTRILAAARAHFFKHGFRNVTMDDLAAELGMSKKTLYTHFPSKSSLLEAVLLDQGARVEADLDRIARESPRDFGVALQRLLACIQRNAGEIQPAFMRDMRREAPELFAIVTRRRREIIERHFGRLFAEGRRAGFIRKDIPVKLILEVLLGAVEAIVNPEKLGALGLTPKAGYSTIISIVLEGIITPEARGR